MDINSYQFWCLFEDGIVEWLSNNGRSGVISFAYFIDDTYVSLWNRKERHLLDIPRGFVPNFWPMPKLLGVGNGENDSAK